MTHEQYEMARRVLEKYGQAFRRAISPYVRAVSTFMRKYGPILAADVKKYERKAKHNRQLYFRKKRSQASNWQHWRRRK